MSVLDKVKTACESKTICESTAVWPLSQLTQEPAKASILYHVTVEYMKS